MNPDTMLRTAAVGFAAAAAYGTGVALRYDIPGEPFGVRAPLAVPTGLVVGWGAGVAPPWPMPVAALVAGARAGATRRGAAPGRAAAALGLGCIAGTLIEPVTHRRRGWTPGIRAAITLNLVASAALLAAGLRHAAVARSRTAVSPAASRC